MVTLVRWEVRRMLPRTHTNRVRHTALSDPFQKMNAPSDRRSPPVAAGFEVSISSGSGAQRRRANHLRRPDGRLTMERCWRKSDVFLTRKREDSVEVAALLGLAYETPRPRPDADTRFPGHFSVR